MLEGISHRLTELELRRRESLSVLQQAVVELSVAIASQLTYRIIDSGEFAVEKMVETVVSRLPAAEHVSLRLHPDDLALFQQRIKSIPAASLDARSLHLVADPAVGRGGCLAELPEQGILCDIELLLGDLHTELMEGLSDAQVERRRAQGTDRSLRRFPDRRETA
ncbi:MAG: FliH/SctL family protein [Planctomycetaceae bacterium]